MASFAPSSASLVGAPLALACALLLSIAACGGASESGRDVSAPGSPSAGAAATEESRVLTFTSTRMGITLPLAGGRGWRIDDHTRPTLLGLHAPSGSRLVAARWVEGPLQTRASCEAGARTRGHLPARDGAIVDEAAGLRKDGTDARIWVTLEPGADEHAPIVGRAAVVIADLRRCVLVTYESRVASANDQATLAARLATFKRVTLDAITLTDPLDGPTRRESRPR